MKKFHCFIIGILLLTGCNRENEFQLNKQTIISDSVKTKKLTFLSDSIYINEPYKLSNDKLSAATWWFRLETQELPIVERLPKDELYLINNYPAVDQLYSNINIKRDNQIIALGNDALDIYQGGAALVEGKSISLLHEINAKTNAIGQFVLVDYGTSNYISGSWKFNGNSGPSLIADIKSPRHFRIIIDKIEPALKPNEKFEFILYVDNIPISNRLINSTCIDVYGSKVSIHLAQWSPVGSFIVHGLYISW